jgi:transposase
MNKSRQELFESEDRPNALPLPPKPYEYAEWLHAKVNIDYHIEADRHYYSVPFHLLHERLDVRLTATTVEVFHKGERVAAHARSYARGLPTTVKEHMPPEHRFFAEWSPTRFIQWASKVGVATAEVVSRIISSRAYPEQAYRGCMGIMQLSRQYDQNRVEAAAKRAIQFNTCSYRSMRSILISGLDTQSPLETDEQRKSLPPHENVRGQEFYH